jgi:hypothetical protein
LFRELEASSEKSGWSPDAVFEHEMAFIAAKQDNPVHPASLAGQSPYRLKDVQTRLQQLSLAGFARESVDEKEGALVFSFPPLDYPRPYFDRNLEVLSKLPASVTEEMDAKISKIMMYLGVLILVLFVLAFVHVPFPILIAAFLIGAPVIALTVWKKKERVSENGD